MHLGARTIFDQDHLPHLERQQQTLLQISRMWRHYEGDIERAMREITETSATALGLERVSVWIYDRTRRVISCKDLYEATPDRHSGGCELSAGQFPAYFAAMESEEVIVAEDAIADPRTREFAEPYLKPNGIGAMLDAPIRACGQLAGVLCHEHLGGPRKFHIWEINTATHLANMLAAAFEFQRRLESEFEARRSLALLRAVFEASGAALLSLGDDGRARDFNQQAIDLWRLPPGLFVHDPDPGAVVRHMSQETTNPQEFIELISAAKEPEFESRATVELIDGRVIECTSQPQKIGAHVVGRVWSFRDVTLQRRLEEELRLLSTRDPLTGLCNRRRMEDVIMREMARTGRTGQPFCVAMIDIDHFKAVNDTHGHKEGDRVLRAVADDLQQRVRATDYVGRWGGEEFVVVLTGAALDGAVRALDELREQVARERSGSPRVTVSVGVAEFSEGQSIEELVAAADERMYEAKRSGRNRVVA